MGHVGVLASYKELTGREAEFSEFERTLREYRLESLLVLCCRLQMVVRAWENPPDYGAEDRLLDRLLPAAIARQIRERGGPSSVSTFNRISLLFMIKSAILFATPDGQAVATQEQVEHIGLCFLMANDLVLGYIPQPTDTFLQNVAGLMPFGDLLPHETTMEDLTRYRIFFSEILQRPAIRGHPFFQDLDALFASRCGLEYRRFSSLIFGAATRYIAELTEEQLTGEQVYLPPTFFSSTNATEQELTSFFSLTASGLEDLRASLRRAERPTDFTAIQNKPLLRHADGTYLCLDPGFLLDKAGKALFWTIRSLLTEKS